MKFLSVSRKKGHIETVSFGKPWNMILDPMLDPFSVSPMHIYLAICHGNDDISMLIPNDEALIPFIATTANGFKPVLYILLVDPFCQPCLPKVPSDLMLDFSLVNSMGKHFSKLFASKTLHEEDRGIQSTRIHCEFMDLTSCLLYSLLFSWSLYKGNWSRRWPLLKAMKAHRKFPSIASRIFNNSLAKN